MTKKNQKKSILKESIERRQKQLENLQSQVSCYLKIIQLFSLKSSADLSLDLRTEQWIFCVCFLGSLPSLSPGKKRLKNRVVKESVGHSYLSCGSYGVLLSS